MPTTSSTLVNDYIINLDQLLNEEDCVKSFSSYLKDNYAEESLLFLLKAKQLKTVTDLQQQIQLALGIYNEFIATKQESTTELNLPQKIKKQIASNIGDIIPKAEEQKQHQTIQQVLQHRDIAAIAIEIDDDLESPTGSLNGERAYTPTEDDDCLSECSTASSSANISTQDLVSIIIDKGSNSVANIFVKAEYYIYLSLKEGHFHRFIQSPHFTKLIEEKGDKAPALLERIGKVKAISQSAFINVIRERKKKTTKEDFRVLKHYMFHENYWKCVANRRNYKTYLSIDTFKLAEELGKKAANEVHFFKYEMEFPFPALRCIGALTSIESRLKNDNTLKSSTLIDLLDKESPEDVFCEVFQEVYKFGFPFQDRCGVQSVGAMHDKTDDLYMICCRSFDSPKEVEIKKTVKFFVFGGWCFKPTSETSCKYYQIMGVDFRGYIPVSIVAAIIKKRAAGFYKAAMKLLQESEKNGWAVNKEDTALRSLEITGSIEL
ncbi:hypothetical protein ABK040_005799 [Willaertia magna]